MRGTTFTVRNALIYDGTGAEPVVGDVAVVVGRIAE
jgi:N-acyl-D-aspartate/D-glutamate deacylase